MAGFKFKKLVNKIEKIFCESNNVNDFASGYFAYLKDILNRIDLNSLGRLVKEFEEQIEPFLTDVDRQRIIFRSLRSLNKQKKNS